ncbi:MAG: MFS transporter [Acidiferrobacteraceae bacterium]
MKPGRAAATFVVYGAGFLQGAAFVLIPALGKIFSEAPYHFGHVAYGLLYLPETVGAIAAALAAGSVETRLGIRGVFRTGVTVNAVAMALLTGTFFVGARIAYGLALAESLCLGAGFGLTLAAANEYAGRLYGDTAVTAVTLLNALIGGATALSPLILHALSTHAGWGWWPAVLGFAFLLSAMGPLPDVERPRRDGASLRVDMLPFLLAALIYAICEGSFGSWADLYVTVDHGQSARYGALALSAFWGAMTLFRVFFSAIPERWVSRRTLYLAAPVGMAACFATLPFLRGHAPLIGVFAAAGAACSIYYPFTMAFGLAAYPQAQTRIAGLVVAGLMAGEGIGSFGIGPLQGVLKLSRIYLLSTAWVIPLIMLAWIVARHPQARERA